MQAFNKCSKERFLYKNSDLEYQREYRLAFGMEMPEDHYINLDPIKSAKIISSKSLKNIIFVIDYKSYKKDEEKVVPWLCLCQLIWGKWTAENADDAERNRVKIMQDMNCWMDKYGIYY